MRRLLCCAAPGGAKAGFDNVCAPATPRAACSATAAATQSSADDADVAFTQRAPSPPPLPPPPLLEEPPEREARSAGDACYAPLELSLMGAHPHHEGVGAPFAFLGARFTRAAGHARLRAAPTADAALVFAWCGRRARE